jgi:hypothetical protein
MNRLQLMDAWASYKITVLKVSLAIGAIVLVLAQLLPEVGNFLQRQLFLSVGAGLGLVLLVLDTLLSSPTNSPRESIHLARLQNTSELSQYFGELSKKRELRIDIASYSSETFYATFVGLLDSVAKGHTSVRKITIRLLVPDCSRTLGVPRLLDTGRESPAYNKLLVQRTQRFVDEFRNSFSMIRTQQPNIEADFAVRLHRLSPLIKFVIIQDEFAYYGLYPIDRTPVMISNQQQMFLDYRGERAALIRAEPESANDTEKATNEELANWFDSVWEHSDEG